MSEKKIEKIKTKIKGLNQLIADEIDDLAPLTQTAAINRHSIEILTLQAHKCLEQVLLQEEYVRAGVSAAAKHTHHMNALAAQEELGQIIGKLRPLGAYSQKIGGLATRAKNHIEKIAALPTVDVGANVEIQPQQAPQTKKKARAVDQLIQQHDVENNVTNCIVSPNTIKPVKTTSLKEFLQHPFMRAFHQLYGCYSAYIGTGPPKHYYGALLTASGICDDDGTYTELFLNNYVNKFGGSTKKLVKSHIFPAAAMGVVLCCAIRGVLVQYLVATVAKQEFTFDNFLALLVKQLPPSLQGTITTDNKQLHNAVQALYKSLMGQTNFDYKNLLKQFQSKDVEPNILPGDGPTNNAIKDKIDVKSKEWALQQYASPLMYLFVLQQSLLGKPANYKLDKSLLPVTDAPFPIIFPYEYSPTANDKVRYTTAKNGEKSVDLDFQNYIYLLASAAPTTTTMTRTTSKELHYYIAISFQELEDALRTLP